MNKILRKTLIRYFFLPIIFYTINAQCSVIPSNILLKMSQRGSSSGKDFSERRTYVNLPIDSDPITFFTIDVPETATTPGSTQPFACWVNILYIADVHSEDPLTYDALLRTGQNSMTLLFFVTSEDLYCSMLYKTQSTFDNETSQFINESIVRFIDPVINRVDNVITVKIQNQTGTDVFTNKTFTAIGTLKNQFAYITCSHNGPIKEITERNTLITYENPVIFNQDPILNGDFLTYQFVKAYVPLMIVANDVTGITQNIILKDFSPEYIELGTNSNLIFGDQTTIEFNKNEDLNMTWTFAGNCVINGNGYALTIGDLGNIIVDGPDSSITFNNIIIKGMSNQNIRCLDNTGNITFRLATIVLQDDFNFNTGNFSILDQCNITGNRWFNYLTDQESIIQNNSCLYLDRNSGFYYNPPVANNQLLKMNNTSSTLWLQGASLSVSTTGLDLTSGTLVIENTCPFYNDLATSLSQAITINNVDIFPGSTIDLRSGILNHYENDV